MTNRKIISLSKSLAEVNLNVPRIKHLLSPVAASLKSHPLIINVLIDQSEASIRVT